MIEVVFHLNVTRIQGYAFGWCSNLRRIVKGLPEGLIHLGVHAFYDCNSLEGQLTLPQSVRNIDQCCFTHCTSIESVVFHPTANINFQFSIFFKCTNLRSVTLPSQNLQRIPNAFFYGCSSLEEIRMPTSVQEIGSHAFKRSGLRSIDLSENIHRIGFEAFCDCTSLETVTMRSSSSSSSLRIDGNMFKYCPSLSIIRTYPWLWPAIFAHRLNDDDTDEDDDYNHDEEEDDNDDNVDFIFKFFSQYHTHIFDFVSSRGDRGRVERASYSTSNE